MRPTLRVGLIFGTAMLALVQLAGVRGVAAAGDPEGGGEWTAPFGLQVQGIHTTLLPTGRVLLFQRPGLSYGSDARVWDPKSGAIDDVSFTSARDLFCAGQSLLPDGRILVTGGHAHGSGQRLGASQTDIFDPTTETWTEAASLAEARWYPSQVELGDGSTLIFGGWADPDSPATTVESFDPSNGSFRQLPPTASRDVGLYPRTLLLPTGSVFMAGPTRTTQLFDPVTSTWSVVDDLNVAQRAAGNAVLLPGLTKVLAVGGSPQGATATAEIIDFAQPNPSWRPISPMHNARKHAAAVLLPNGEVMVVGGGLTDYYGDPITQPELFDPATETWTTMASQVAPRMYHSAAVLLPDARVLSVGQDNDTDYGTTGEIFSPPYLFRGPRPTIKTAPSAMVYGSTFIVRSPDAARIARVALIAPGSSTHSVNFSQRYVDVPFSVAGSRLRVTAPLNGNVAPPGWYMLFLVDTDGVPSVATWVHVGSTLQGFAERPVASPTLNERSAPQGSERLAGPAPTSPAGAEGLAPAREGAAPPDGPIAVWTDPTSPDGSGHLSPANPSAQWYGALLLRCRTGPPG
jgi:hypothetical protein